MNNNDFLKQARRTIQSCKTVMAKEFNISPDLLNNSQLNSTLLHQIIFDECIHRIKLASIEIDRLSEQLTNQETPLNLRLSCDGKPNNGLELTRHINSFNTLYENTSEYFSNEQKKAINKDFSKFTFKQAKLMADNHLLCKDPYSVTSTYFSFIWSALASIGVCDTNKKDIYYDPGLTKVGLTPQLVDKLLLESKIRDLDKEFKIFEFYYNVDRKILLETKESSILPYMEEHNVTFAQWKELSLLPKENLDKICRVF